MHLAYIVDVPPGDRRSAGSLAADFIAEATSQGHQISVLVPDHTLTTPYNIDQNNGATIIRLKTPQTKVIWGDDGKGGKTLSQKLRRGFAELSMPYFMRHNLPQIKKLDGIIFYSPSVFFAPLIHHLKSEHQCPVYEVLRDLYPHQLVQSGDISAHGIPYKIMQWATYKQHQLANTVGVEGPFAITHLQNTGVNKPNLEVLHNWMFPAPDIGCPIDVSKTKLAGRTIFVYAGTMGTAQGVDIFFDLAASLKDRPDIGFLFVGFGSEVDGLKKRIQEEDLDNVLIEAPIKPSEIPGLYKQCHVGLVALKPGLPNIPGKFVSYMQQGLPVFGIVSENNGMVALVNKYRTGEMATDRSIEKLRPLALKLIDGLKHDNEIGSRCQQMGQDLFQPEVAVHQIVSALEKDR